MAAILVGSQDHWTQFWKGATQESFQQSLVEIGSVVSEEMIFKKKFIPPFFLICIIGQNRQKFGLKSSSFGHLRLPTKMAVKLKTEKKGIKFKKKSSPLKLLSQSQPNFAEMILGWSPSKIVSSISDLQTRWPPQPSLN
jgi:hypothetical protein